MILINLLPEEFRKKEAPKLSMPEIPIRGTLLTLAALLIGFQVLLVGVALYERTSLASAKSQIESLRESNREIVRKKAETLAMTRRIGQADVLTTRKVFWSQLLNALSDSMTRGVWLNSLQIQRGGGQPTPKTKGKKGASQDGPVYLRLSGSAVGAGEELAAIGEFIRTLKAGERTHSYFSDVSLTESNQKKLKDTDVYDYTILCQFRPDKVEAA